MSDRSNAQYANQLGLNFKPRRPFADFDIKQSRSSSYYLKRQSLVDDSIRQRLKAENQPPQSLNNLSKAQITHETSLDNRQISRRVIRRAIAATRDYQPQIKASFWQKFNPKNYTRLQLALNTMAILVFIAGAVIALQTININHKATNQVAALARADNSKPTSKPVTSSVPVPSTTKPSSATVRAYSVPPNAPRYLNIPEIGVNNAIILNLGLLKDGSLATPPNVYETGWYNQSTVPGEPGAMLIDGHVSSWTTKGVFYGLKNLKAGDSLSVTRGDGKIFNYQVVKTQIFSSGSVDMQSAITPVDPGTPGLNLITCTGDVIPGTSTFNERIIVYTKQV